jgi:transposase
VRRIRDAGSTVIQAARDLHLSWPTGMDAFRAQAREIIETPPPKMDVLGIDETRRGRPRWEQDPATDKWQLVRDWWHTGFVDALGAGGLLGQVEGRTVADVLAWLATTPLTWRESIQDVAIDMSSTYRAAVRIGLPHATVVVDHFHVVQLADKMLSTVRRRTTAEIRGRRGRANDPEWKARRRLLRNHEDLTDEQFATMWNALLGEGKIGQTLLTAWIAKENLRNLLALARTGSDGTKSARPAGSSSPGARTPTSPKYGSSPPPSTAGGPEIAAFLGTGHSNAESEGINRVIKLVTRNAFGSATPRTNGHGHAASPPAELAGTSAPLNFEDPVTFTKVLRGAPGHSNTR